MGSKKHIRSILSLGALTLSACSGGTTTEEIGKADENLSPFWVKATWAIPEVFGADNDQDGLIDLTPPKSAYWTTSFEVTVDACATLPPRSTLQQFVWELGSPEQPEPRVTRECRTTFTIPANASYNLKITAQLEDGSAGVAQLTLAPKNLIVVSMGDSVASGEGNPDVPGSDPRWVDRRCHRSAKAGPARAALELEHADPHTSVTFLSVACSGAGVFSGILNEYNGQEPDGSFFALEPQLTQVNRAMCRVQRTCAPSELPAIDALLLNVGANDIGFGEMVRRCAFPKNDCMDAVRGPLVNNLGVLPGLYAELQNALAGRLNIKDTYITEYPDPTKDDFGNYCTSIFWGGVDDNFSTGKRTALGALAAGAAAGLLPIHGLSVPAAIWAAIFAEQLHDGNISPAENRFAFEEVVTPLNARVEEAARNNGWHFVSGIQSQFARHGYCAQDNFIERYDQAKAGQGNPDGSMHPNDKGQKVYADRIGAAVRLQLPAENPHPDSIQANTLAYGFLLSPGGEGTFTAPADYSENSLVAQSTDPNRVTRLATGFYRAELPKLASYFGGNVQAAAYGSDNLRCKVPGWLPNGDTLYAYVQCYDPLGNPQDSAFTLSFISRFQSNMALGYLRADQPTTDSYVATGPRQFNGGGGETVVERTELGGYRVTFNGLNINGGTVQVTAGGWGSEYCKVAGWNNQAVDVKCFDTHGNHADSEFHLVFSQNSPVGTGSYAYAWADEPSAASYVPHRLYQRVDIRRACRAITEPVQINRLGLGSYDVFVPELFATRSLGQVTAYGPSSELCKVTSWYSSGTGTHVGVVCHDASGNPADSRFAFTYAVEQRHVCF